MIDKCKLALKNGMTDEQCQFDQIEPWINEHLLNLTANYNTWLYRLSSTASSAITGPANFPVERQRKKHQSANNAQESIAEYRMKSVKKILNKAIPVGDGSTIRSDDSNAVSKTQQKIAQLEKERETMKDLNKIIRKYFKLGDPNVSEEKKQECIKAIQDKYNYSLSNITSILKPNYVNKVCGYESFVLQNLGQNIRRLKLREKEITNTQQASVDENFETGVAVETSDDRKICIYFDSIPNDDTRTILKRNAFKFSRNRNNAWVRKITANAIADYRRNVRPILINS